MEEYYKRRLKNGQTPLCATGKPIEILWESSDPLLQSGVPIVLENTALILDRMRDKLFARCTFRSFTDKVISSLHIEIICRNAQGTPLGEPIPFQYPDLRARCGGKFGQTQPIEIREKDTRTITVSICRLTLADGDEITGSGSAHPLADPIPLHRHFGDPKLAEAYTRKTTPDARFLPEFTDDYWRCACGCLNTPETESCRQCGCTAQQLTAVLEEARQDQQASGKHRGRKTVLIALILVLILGAAAGCGIIFYGIPYRHYTDARALLDSGEYDAAHQAFLALGDFRDSADMANEAIYQKGIAAMENEAYLIAMDIFESLGSYSDSQDKRLTTMLLWEAAVLGSPTTVNTQHFAETVTLLPEYYELYYNTIVLYLNSPNCTNDLYSTVYNVSFLLELLPASYQDTAALSELMAVLTHEGSRSLLQDYEALVKKCWDYLFLRSIVQQDAYITMFLEGYWTTSDGAYYLHFYQKGSSSIYSEHSLPCVEQPAGKVYYDIRDLTYIFTDGNDKELAKVYDFELVSYDTIRVYCYKNNRTYTLYRE